MFGISETMLAIGAVGLLVFIVALKIFAVNFLPKEHVINRVISSETQIDYDDD